MLPLLLLHGAIGASGQLQPLKELLSLDREVHATDLPGHGGRPFGEGVFSIASFADDVLRFMDEKGFAAADIFGYSMGGYIACYLAKHHPSRIGKVVTLATKFHWDEAVAAKEVQMLNADKISLKLPTFAETLQKRHSPNDWKQVLNRTAELLLELGASNTLKENDYREILAPCLVLLGDRDKMITLEETVAVYKALPAAQMGILPSTPHPIEQVNLPGLVFFLRQFLDADRT